jgi:hypothetical protein
VAVLWTLAACMAGTPALAAEWALEPSISVKGEFNDNILLTTAPHDPVYGLWTSPGAKFKGSTERLEIEGSVLADFVRYYQEEGLDITNLYFPVAARYTTEKDRLGLEGGYTRDNTLIGELQQTGVINTRRQRNQGRVKPTWSHLLAERWTFDGSYEYVDVTYDDPGLSLFDYRMHTGTAGLSYRASEKDQVSGTGYYVDYFSPVSKIGSIFYGAQLGWSHEFSETMSAWVTGGVRLISSTFTDQGQTRTEDDFIWVASGRVEKRFETGSLHAEIGRDIYPSGLGFLIRSDHVQVQARKDLTPTLTASVTLDGFVIDPVISTTTIPNNRFMRIEPRLHWRTTQWLSLDVAYTYSRFEVPSVDTIATGNAVYLTLSYYPPKLAWSR